MEGSFQRQMSQVIHFPSVKCAVSHDWPSAGNREGNLARQQEFLFLTESWRWQLLVISPKAQTWQQSCCIKAQETCIYTQATQGRMLSDRDFTLLPALLASLLGGSLHKSLPTITSASACRAAWPQHRQILIPAEEILISQLLHHSSVQWSFAAPPACLGASTTECWREDVRQKPAEFLACQKTKVYPLHFY